MNKFIFLISFLSLSTAAWSQCKNKINNSKVILFVDTNDSDKEIASATKSACARGERLVVVPENRQIYKEHITNVSAKQKTYQACWKDHPADSQTACKSIEEDYMKAYRVLTEFRNKQPAIQSQVDNTLKKLNDQKAQIKSVAISGHDGGGSFSGFKGSFNRFDMADLIGKYPDINKVESALLLGCYTGVQKEVEAWKAIFPGIKIIAGYDGSAPLSERPQGHDYIEDVLIKEKTLKNIQNPNSVNDLAKQLIDGLGGLNAAVYLHPSCPEDQNEFYYASKADRKFNKYDISACDKAMGEFQKYQPNFNKYMSGELEPPTDTAGGELRTIYNFVRSNEHCFKDNNVGQYMAGQQVFNLLFWHGMKQNFAEYYKDDLKEAQEILSTINPEEIVKNMENQIKQYNDGITYNEKILAEINKDPKGYVENIRKQFEAMQVKMNEYWNDKILHSVLNAQETGKTISAEDKKVLEDFQTFQKDYMEKSIESQLLKGNSIDMIIQAKQNTNNYMKQIVSNQSLALAELKSKPDALKNIFTPTADVIKTKSRKEILDNIHKMHNIMSSYQLTPKQSGAMRWLTDVSSKHLQYFENPFSWHEYTGVTEAPNQTKALKSYIENAAMMQSYYGGNGGGYGFAGGGIWGSGNSSGSQGGAQSGSNGGEQQQQQQY